MIDQRQTFGSWVAGINSAPRRWLLLFAAILSTQISPWWYPTPDACSYLSIARSMAQGGPVANLGEQTLWYPPGYPLIISPAFLVSDRPLLLLSFMQWGLAVGFMIGFFRWVRGQLPEAAALMTGLAVINLGVWIHFHRTLSEIAFMCAGIWTLHALTALRRTALAGRPALVPALAAGLIVAALSMIRQAGMALAAGFAVALLLDAAQRRVGWRRAMTACAAAVLPGVVAVLALMAYEERMAALHGARTYLDNFDHPEVNLALQLLEGLRLRISDIGQVTLPFMFKAYARSFQWLNVNMAIYLPLTCVLTLGWWRLVHTRRDIFALALPFYLLLYITWSIETGARFLVPVVGLLMVCLWQALERFREKRQAIFAVLLGAHFCAAVGYWVGIEIPRGREMNRQWPVVEELAARVRMLAAPGAVVDCPDHVRLMLQLALDHGVPRVDEPGALHTEPQWIVAPAKPADHDGFCYAGSVGSYSVWAKLPPHLTHRPAAAIAEQPDGRRGR